jgi:hypothetical protein
MNANLDLVASIVATRYPSAEFVAVMLVGAEGHVDCVGNGQVASRTHADRIDQLAAHPNATGPDLDIPCSQYADPLGHLLNAGAAKANGDLGAFYSGG